MLAKSRLQRGGDFFLLTLVIWHHVGYSRSSKSDAANLGRRLEGFIKTWFLEVGERLEGLEVSMEFIKLIRLWTYNFRRKTVKDPQVQIFYLNFVRVKWWKFRSASISMGLVSTHVKIRKARLWFLHFRGPCKSFFPSELECRYIDTCIQVWGNKESAFESSKYEGLLGTVPIKKQQLCKERLPKSSSFILPQNQQNNVTKSIVIATTPVLP